jgi:rhodanese-related sulfurtransferase
MKRILLILSLWALLLSGCASKPENITFTGEIESITEDSIMVMVREDVGFDRASVFINEIDLDFEPAAGDNVEVIILPDIRKSLPVQVTAVKVTLIENGEAPPANGTQSNPAVYKKITAQEAKAIIDSETVIILDVRTQAEYNEGHIANSMLIPNTEIAAKAELLLPEKDAKILIYCRSGNRSAQAAKVLIDMGYTQVYDFGGILDWPYDLVKD